MMLHELKVNVIEERDSNREKNSRQERSPIASFPMAITRYFPPSCFSSADQVEWLYIPF